MVSEAVLALAQADDLDGIDSAMARAQRYIRSGNLRVSIELDQMARGSGASCGVDERCLAVKTLAGARVLAIESLVIKLIVDLCAAHSEQLQMAAIASATHLSENGKRTIRQAIESLSRQGSPRVRRAAMAFLRAS